MDRQKKYAILLAVFVGVLIGAGVAYLASHVGRDAVSSDVREEPVKVKTHEEKTEKKVENIYNIGITEEEFRQRFNKIADEYELDLRLTKRHIYEGTHANVYEAPLNINSSLTVSYEPDTGLVRGILLSGTTATEIESVRFLSAMERTR